MKIWDYCFYQVIRVNMDDINPPLLAYISGILLASFPLWFNLITLSILLPILPKEIDYHVMWNYYYYLAGVIVLIFAIRYRPEKYKLLVEKWGNKARTTKGKMIVILYVFSSFIIGFISLYMRWHS